MIILRSVPGGTSFPGIIGIATSPAFVECLYCAWLRRWRTFRFAASPNRTEITVGEFPGVSKKGPEYMWVRYADAPAKAIVKEPVAVYVEKVYEEGDFAGLGIGT